MTALAPDFMRAVDEQAAMRDHPHIVQTAAGRLEQLHPHRHGQKTVLLRVVHHRDDQLRQSAAARRMTSMWPRVTGSKLPA